MDIIVEWLGQSSMCGNSIVYVLHNQVGVAGAICKLGGLAGNSPAHFHNKHPQVTLAASVTTSVTTHSTHYTSVMMDITTCHNNTITTRGSTTKLYNNFLHTYLHTDVYIRVETDRKTTSRHPMDSIILSITFKHYKCCHGHYLAVLV